MRGAVLMIVVALFGTVPAIADPPQRVATMGLCTDQLVMMLAEPDRIVSVHWVSQDSADSAMASQAAAYPANHGLAEEIITLEPDLVFAGPFNSPFAKAMLESQGVRVEIIPAAVTLDEVRRNIRLVANALGEPERGEALIGSFNRELAATKNALSESDTRALVYGANGYSAGRPSLFDDLMLHLGLTNVAVDKGHQGWVKMSIEDVVDADPDLLILGEYRRHAPSQANSVLDHPALAKLRDGQTGNPGADDALELRHASAGPGGASTG